MHNYYNILPAILIDIFIILVFEGLLFFFYLDVQQEQLISNQLNSLIEYINTNNQLDSNNRNYLHILSKLLQPFITHSMSSEKKFIENNYKLGIIFFVLLLLIIVIILFIYTYIVIKIFGKTIDWITIIITVLITIGLIIVLELLYIKYILFNKKFNESQIKMDFIKSLL